MKTWKNNNEIAYPLSGGDGNIVRVALFILCMYCIGCSCSVRQGISVTVSTKWNSCNAYLKQYYHCKQP